MGLSERLSSHMKRSSCTHSRAVQRRTQSALGDPEGAAAAARERSSEHHVEGDRRRHGHSERKNVRSIDNHADSSANT
jgi:hypothetical protein